MAAPNAAARRLKNKEQGSQPKTIPQHSQRPGAPIPTIPDRMKKKPAGKAAISAFERQRIKRVRERAGKGSEKVHNLKAMLAVTTAKERTSEGKSGLSLNEKFRLQHSMKKGAEKKALRSNLKSTTQAERAAAHPKSRSRAISRRMKKKPIPKTPGY